MKFNMMVRKFERTQTNNSGDDDAIIAFARLLNLVRLVSVASPINWTTRLYHQRLVIKSIKEETVKISNKQRRENGETHSFFRRGAKVVLLSSSHTLQHLIQVNKNTTSTVRQKMRELLQQRQLALSVLFGLYFLKTGGGVVEASSALPRLNTFAESELGRSDTSSSTVSSSSYSYAYEPSIPDQDDTTTTRTIRIWGSLPATYVGKVAAFGNALDAPFAANLMLPPDDPWLCEFPESLKNTSSSSSSSSSSFSGNNVINLPPVPYKIALFVSLNGCSAEQKARVALEIRQNVTPRLELLILYSTNPNDENDELLLESLQLDPGSPWLDNDLNLDGERNLGILQVPQRYATGIDVRIRVHTNARNADPRLGMPTNEEWKLEVEVAPLSGYNDDGYHNGGSGGHDGTYRHGGNEDDMNVDSMYWFRIVLFTLLIVSPCCRAGYLWHAGGGRFHWRRNDSGRIVGILYVP